MNERINPIFERPIIQLKPLVSARPIGPVYREPMLELSDNDFPISLEERARRYRTEMRKLGFTFPYVSEPDSD